MSDERLRTIKIDKRIGGENYDKERKFDLYYEELDEST